MDRGRPGSKHHVIVDRHGTPLAVSVTGGNRHDVTQLIPLLEAAPPVRGLRGRPRNRPKRLFADRGYDFDKYRRLLWKRGIKPLIARRGVAHGSGLGNIRWVVERTFAWLHQFKRLRIRYERRAEFHQALLELACCIICLRRILKAGAVYDSSFPPETSKQTNPMEVATCAANVETSSAASRRTPK